MNIRKGTKMKLNKTIDLVKEILNEYPATRNSDNLLYLTVVESIGKGNSDKSISEILLGLEELGLPCFETVRRTRQKLQADFPELQACDAVQDFRTEREEEFRKEFGC